MGVLVILSALGSAGIVGVYIDDMMALLFGWMRLVAAVALILVALFLLGIVRAKISGLRQMKNAIRMVVIGGIAIAVGIAAGKIFTAI